MKKFRISYKSKWKGHQFEFVYANFPGNAVSIFLSWNDNVSYIYRIERIPEL